MHSNNNMPEIEFGTNSDLISARLKNLYDYVNKVKNKSEVDEVYRKILGLKARFRSIVGFDWKPLATSEPIPTYNKQAVPGYIPVHSKKPAYTPHSPHLQSKLQSVQTQYVQTQSGRTQSVRTQSVRTQSGRNLSVSTQKITVQGNKTQGNKTQSRAVGSVPLKYEGNKTQARAVGSAPLQYDPKDPFGESMSLKDVAATGRTHILKDRKYLAVWKGFAEYTQDILDDLLAGRLAEEYVDELLAEYLHTRVNITVSRKVCSR